MKLPEKWRKILHILCIVVCVIAAVSLVYEVVVQLVVQAMLHSDTLTPSGDIGIIGGADGPTAIVVGTTVVKSSAPLVRRLVYLLVIVLSGVGMYLTRKKKKL